MAFPGESKKGRRADLRPLVAAVALFSAYFLLPNNFLGMVGQGLSRLPGAGRLAAAGAWAAVKLGLMPAPVTFSDLLAEERMRRPLAPAETLSAAAAARSSTDLVKGTVASLSAISVPGIKGFLTPADAAKAPSGESILKSDLGGSRADYLAKASSEEAAGLPLAYAGKDFLAGPGRAVAGDFLASALGATESPEARASRLGVSRSKISRGKAAGLMAQSHEALTATSAPVFKSFSDLTRGQAAATLSRSPACTAKSGCPGETATTLSGAIYDGNLVGMKAPGVLNAPPFDGKSIPDLSGADLGGPAKNLQEAEKARKDAQACESARGRYEPEIADLTARVGSLASEMSALNCGSSGFLGGLFAGSESRACRSKRAEKDGACRLMANLRCAERTACPLTAGEPCDGGWACD